MQNRQVIGLLFCLAYIFTSVFALFGVEHVLNIHGVYPLLFLWLSSIVATISLHLLIKNKVKDVYLSLLKHKQSFFIMLLSVMMIVTSSYYSVHHIGTMQYILLYFALVGFFSGVFEYYKSKVLDFFPNQLFIILGILIYVILCVLLIRILYNISIISVVLTIIGALSGVLYSKYSQQYNVKESLSALEILSVRYWLIIILFPLIFNKAIYSQIELVIANIHSLSELIISAILTLILPLYFSQKSLEYISFTMNGVLNATIIPILSVITNLIIYHDSNNQWFLIISCFLALNSLLIFYTKSYK